MIIYIKYAIIDLKIKKKSSSLLTLAKNKLMRTACKADAEVMTTTVKLGWFMFL